MSELNNGNIFNGCVISSIPDEDEPLCRNVKVNGSDLADRLLVNILFINKDEEGDT